MDHMLKGVNMLLNVDLVTVADEGLHVGNHNQVKTAREKKGVCLMKERIALDKNKSNAVAPVHHQEGTFVVHLSIMGKDMEGIVEDPLEDHPVMGLPCFVEVHQDVVLREDHPEIEKDHPEKEKEVPTIPNEGHLGKEGQITNAHVCIVLVAG